VTQCHTKTAQFSGNVPQYVILTLFVGQRRGHLAHKYVPFIFQSYFPQQVEKKGEGNPANPKFIWKIDISNVLVVTTG